MNANLPDSPTGSAHSVGRVKNVLGQDSRGGEAVILLHPPLPSVGVSIGVQRGCHCQQNDRTLVDVLGQDLSAPWMRQWCVAQTSSSGHQRLPTTRF